MNKERSHLGPNFEQPSFMNTTKRNIVCTAAATPVEYKCIMHDVMGPPPLPLRYTQSACGAMDTRNHKLPSYRERDDNYAAVVIHLTPRWRIIVCKDDIQWILQQRSVAPPNVGTWSGKSYSTTRKGLIAACSDRKLLSDPSARRALDVLPSDVRTFIAGHSRS